MSKDEKWYTYLEISPNLTTPLATPSLIFNPENLSIQINIIKKYNLTLISVTPALKRSIGLNNRLAKWNVEQYTIVAPMNRKTASCSRPTCRLRFAGPHSLVTTVFTDVRRNENGEKSKIYFIIMFIIILIYICVHVTSFRMVFLSCSTLSAYINLLPI